MQLVPSNLTVEDSVFYLDGKYIDENHADSIADRCGFIEEGGKTGLQHLEKYLQTRQDAARYVKIKPGHPAYERVTELKRTGQQVCDSEDHNDGSRCSNPGCFKYNTPE